MKKLFRNIQIQDSNLRACEKSVRVCARACKSQEGRILVESTPGLSRLRWALFEHFFEFGALFYVSSTLEHFLDF